MIELDQLKYSLNSYREPLEKLSGSLGLEEKKERIEQLELDMEAPGFWEDLEESQKVVREVKGLKDQVEGYEGLKGQFEDIETLIEMAKRTKNWLRKLRKHLRSLRQPMRICGFRLS